MGHAPMVREPGCVDVAAGDVCLSLVKCEAGLRHQKILSELPTPAR